MRKLVFELLSDQLMNKLPYLMACMRESLRLCPPVPWIGLRTSRDITLPDGRLVPCGTPIVVGTRFIELYWHLTELHESRTNQHM